MRFADENKIFVWYLTWETIIFIKKYIKDVF